VRGEGVDFLAFQLPEVDCGSTLILGTWRRLSRIEVYL
jgi:hypothetical protein